jgi:hypothetical protein
MPLQKLELEKAFCNPYAQASLLFAMYLQPEIPNELIAPKDQQPGRQEYPTHGRTAHLLGGQREFWLPSETDTFHRQIVATTTWLPRMLQTQCI